MSENQLQAYKSSEFGEHILGTREYAGELTIDVRAGHIFQVCKGLKEFFGYNYLSDITAIDYYTDEERYGVAYNLVNLSEGKRLRVSCRVEEHDPAVDSVHKIWPAAMWFERECWDMMGIRFHGHPDLRRIFMPEDFEYFPLRKEFPLIGIPGSIQLPEKISLEDKGYK